METFLGWILGLSLLASVFVTFLSGGATMMLILAAILGLSATTAAAGLAVVREIKEGKRPDA